MSPLERLVVVGLALMLIVCALASRPHVPDGSATVSVRIAAGDTLWGIARQHQIAGLSTAQTADYIARLNGLKSSVLVMGSELRIPAPGTAGAQLASR